jgi:GlpG protein
VRQIGTLPKSEQARRFSDHLLTLGITSRIDDRPDGSAIWVHSEDRVAQARQELETFQRNPDDTRYHAAGTSAEAIRRQESQRDKQFRKNFREMRDQWDRPNLRRRPLTFALIVISVAVFIGDHWPGFPIDLTNALAFSSYAIDERGQPHSRGLEDILHGEVWRLVTPIFIHANQWHILFNMWALSAIGTIIEYRRGTRVLAVLVLVSAIASNSGQYIHMFARNPDHAGFFGGMSGVVYALFGYVWMKGRYEPEQGMILHPTSVQVMLIWLVLCMTPLMGINIANAAHVIGLVVGVLFGLARY